MIKEPLFSSEMLATADSLRQIRLRLYQLIAQDKLPPTFDQNVIATVLVQGIEVCLALEMLSHEMLADGDAVLAAECIARLLPRQAFEGV